MQSDTIRLRALLRGFARRFDLVEDRKIARTHPFSATYAEALVALGDRSEEALSHRALAGLLGIDKSNVTRLCAQMEAAGHVLQVRAPHDARSRLVVLTARGVKLAGELGRASRERFGALLRTIPANERAGVFRALATLNAALDAMTDDVP